MSIQYKKKISSKTFKSQCSNYVISIKLKKVKSKNERIKIKKKKL